MDWPASGIWTATLVAMVLSGCGADETSERCVSGASQPCTLPDGEVGARSCGTEFRWGACMLLVDGGSADDVAAPDIPWLAEGVPPLAIGPCPGGWREVTDDGGVTTCDPQPEGGPIDCPDGEAQFPGESSCSAVGTSCPSDGLPEDLPADRPVIWVLAAAPGGDGTRASPHGGLASFSWGGLAAGTIIAVGRGVYDHQVRLPARQISLWGACVAETTLTSSVTAARESVLSLTMPAEVEIRNLSIMDALISGVTVSGTGAHIVLEDVVVASVGDDGVSAQRGASLTARDLVVRDTRPLPDGTRGVGLEVLDGSRADLRRVVVAGNRTLGVFVDAGGAVLDAEDLAVRDTAVGMSGPTLGFGIYASRGAVVRLTRAALERNAESAVSITDEGSELRLEDFVARDSQPGGRGIGLEVDGGAAAHLARGTVERHVGGLRVVRPRSALEAEDVVVRGIMDLGALFEPRGLGVEQGAQASLTRAVFEDNVVAAVIGLHPETDVSLTDVAIRETHARASDGTFGRGLTVQLGARATLRRVLVARSREVGITASSDGASLLLQDVVVRDTLGRESNGTAGRGLALFLDVTAELRRVSFESNREASVTVHWPGTLLEGTDVQIQSSLERACAASTCPDVAGGTALGAFDDGAISLQTFAVRDAALCGVQLSNGGEIDLSSGTISGTRIGACVQIDGYDTSRLTQDVRYFDNGSNLEASELPVPEALTSL